MYWGSHNSTSSLRVYSWAENSNTINWNDVSIGSWNRTTPYQCAGPDGLNWCARALSTSGYTNDGRIETGWVAGGVIGFMWNASQVYRRVRDRRSQSGKSVARRSVRTRKGRGRLI
jgi:hypothetical protein